MKCSLTEQSPGAVHCNKHFMHIFKNPLHDPAEKKIILPKTVE